MKLIKVFLIQTLLLASTVAQATENAPALSEFVNRSQPEIRMVVESSPAGEPKKARFMKGDTLLAAANVTPSDLVVDVMVGGVYYVTGPQDPTAMCNLSAKLFLQGQNFEIDFDQADVGVQFFHSCKDLAAIAGTYSK